MKRSLSLDHLRAMLANAELRTFDTDFVVRMQARKDVEKLKAQIARRERVKANPSAAVTELNMIAAEYNRQLHAIRQLTLAQWVALADRLRVARDDREHAAKKLALRELRAAGKLKSNPMKTNPVNRWGKKLRKGMRVRVHHPRGGTEEGVITKFETKGAFVRAYGKRLTLDNGFSAAIDDVVEILPKDNPVQVIGTESGHTLHFGPGASYSCPSLKLFGYGTERQLRRAVVALLAKRAGPKTNPVGVHQAAMIRFAREYPGWHSIATTDGGLTKRVALSLEKAGVIEILRHPAPASWQFRGVTAGLTIQDRRPAKANPGEGIPPVNIVIEDRTRPGGLRNFAWRVRFKSGTWSGWHEGYHSNHDAHTAAQQALAGTFGTMKPKANPAGSSSTLTTITTQDGKTYNRIAWTGGDRPPADFVRTREFQQLRSAFFREQVGEWRNYWKDSPDADTRKTFQRRAIMDAWATLRELPRAGVSSTETSILVAQRRLDEAKARLTGAVRRGESSARKMQFSSDVQGYQALLRKAKAAQAKRATKTNPGRALHSRRVVSAIVVQERPGGRSYVAGGGRDGFLRLVTDFDAAKAFPLRIARRIARAFSQRYGGGFDAEQI